MNLLLNKQDNVTKISQKITSTYPFSKLKKGNDGGCMTCAKNQSLTNAPKITTSQKTSYQFNGTLTMHFYSI
jgi:hypothetical protein